MERIEVLIADDHPLFVSGIQAELQAEADITVVGVAENGRRAIELTSELDPDVLLLDMQLPDLDGVEVTRHLRERGADVRILPLSGFCDPEYVLGMMDLGVSGYVVKNESIVNIIRAIRAVARGELYVSPAAASAVFQEKLRSFDSPPTDYGISIPLEEVLRLVARGMSNQEIADRICRSENTVRNHVCRLRELTKTESRAALVAWAWERGMVGEK